MNDILGLDHICASGSIKGISKSDDFLGYKILFMKNNIPISEEKNDILLDNIDSHDVVFLTNSKSISIELIEHHPKNSENIGKYRVIYESNLPPNNNCILQENDNTAKHLSEIFNDKFSKVLDKKTNLSFFLKNSKTNLGLTTIILETQNLENSTKFWTTNFNFKISQFPATLSAKLLELHSPIPSWNAKLLLIENQNFFEEKTFLNLQGWTCLSFIVKKIDSFLTNIVHSDFSYVGKPYDFNIGGKNLKLVFLRGKEQQLIELVEVNQNHD